MKRIHEENLSKILKGLLFKDADSLADLSERIKLTKPTVMRGANELEARGYLETIKKEVGDKRNLPPRKIKLKDVGLLYLIISEKMSDEELEAAFKGYLRDLKIPSLIIEGTKGTLNKIADEIRPKLNPKFLNDEYAKTVLEEAVFKQIITPPSDIKSRRTEKEYKIYQNILQDHPKDVHEILSFLESKVKTLEANYNNAKNIFEYLKKTLAPFNKQKANNKGVKVRPAPGYTDPAQIDGGICRPPKS